MWCDQAREHLSAYLDAELSADLSAAVRAHLDTCPDCRRLLNDLRATSRLLGRLPVHAAPDGLAEDVLREMERRSLLEPPETATGQPHERTLALHRARPWPRALAVAATLLLAAGIGLFAYLGGRTGNIAPLPEPGGGALDRAPQAAATKTRSKEGTPAGTMQLALKQRGLAGKMTNRVHASEPAAAGGTGGFAAGQRGLARRDGADANGAARLGRALAEAPTAGLGSIEDAAGAQAIFGDAVAMRSGAATERLTPDTVTLRTKGVALAPPGAAEGNRLKKGVQEEVANGAAPGLGGTADGTVDAKPKKLAPSDVGLAVAGAPVPREPKAVALDTDGKTTVPTGPAAVQALMHSAAEGGQVAVDALRAAATPDNLVRAENQLVLRAASRDRANSALVRLFQANGWRELPQHQTLAYLREGGVKADAEHGAESAGAGRSAGAAKRFAAAEGCYFLAASNGEDTWVVLTDRDHLSRFGGQLAQAREMTVEDDSSEPFRAIGQLQKQLKAYGVAKADTTHGESAPAAAKDAVAAAAGTKGVPPAAEPEFEEAVRAEAPSIAMRARTKASGKKVVEGLASGVAAPAKRGGAAAGKPAAPPAPTAPTPRPVAKAGPVTGPTLGMSGPAPADKAEALRSTADRFAPARKEATLEKKAKTGDDEKRRRAGGYAYQEADRPDRPDAAKYGAAKRAARPRLEEAEALKRSTPKPQVAFDVTGGNVTAHRVLALPKNQVLLIVRVRQASETAATAAEKTGEADVEAHPEAAKEAAH